MSTARLKCVCLHIGSRHGHQRQACQAAGCDCARYRQHPYAETLDQIAAWDEYDRQREADGAAS